MTLKPQAAQPERMLSVCASYAGMMRHANCRRLAQRLRQRHAWIGLLWRRGRRGRLQRRFVAAGAHASLAAQWWALRRLWPRARLLLHVGCYWEAYGMDARWLAHVLGLQPGRKRRGLPISAGFPCRARALLKRVESQVDRPLLLFAQLKQREGAVAARQLALIWVPSGGEDDPAATCVGRWLVQVGLSAACPTCTFRACGAAVRASLRDGIILAKSSGGASA